MYYFFYVEILCKFFPDFQTWNRIFFWFCKKNPNFPKLRIFIYLELQLSQFSEKSKNLFGSLSLFNFHFTENRKKKIWVLGVSKFVWRNSSFLTKIKRKIWAYQKNFCLEKFQIFLPNSKKWQNLKIKSGGIQFFSEI